MLPTGFVVQAKEFPKSRLSISEFLEQQSEPDWPHNVLVSACLKSVQQNMMSTILLNRSSESFTSLNMSRS